MLGNDTIEKIQKITKDFNLFAIGSNLAIRFGHWDQIDTNIFKDIPELKLKLECIDYDDDCGYLYAYLVDISYLETL